MKEKVTVGVLGFIGGIILITLLYRIVEILLKVSISFSPLLITFIGITINIILTLGILIGIVFVFMVLLWSIKKMEIRISELIGKVNSIKNKPEKLLPIFVATIAGVLTIFLSKDYTPSSTKVFISIMLSILVGLILITTGQPKKKWLWGFGGTFIILILCIFLLISRYNLAEWASFRVFFASNWDCLLAMPYTDIASIGIVVLSFIILIIIAVVYSFKTKIE